MSLHCAGRLEKLFKVPNEMFALHPLVPHTEMMDTLVFRPLLTFMIHEADHLNLNLLNIVDKAWVLVLMVLGISTH